MTSQFAQNLQDGATVVLVNPGRAPVPDRLTGADALFIDREGTGLALSDTVALLERAATMDLLSVIRSDGLATAEIDICASLYPDAIVLPQVQTAQQLAAVIDTVGTEEIALIAQIETPGAVRTLDQIIAVAGVAGYLIGPNDLAAAMGHSGQPDHADVAGAVDAVANRLAAAGLAYGLPALTRDARSHWQARGAQLFYTPLAALTEMEEQS